MKHSDSWLPDFSKCSYLREEERNREDRGGMLSDVSEYSYLREEERNREDRGGMLSDVPEYSYLREEERNREDRGGMLSNNTGYSYTREDGGQKCTPLPYFMSYPNVAMNKGSGKIDEDREYFRQLYPLVMKQYIRVIVDVLDRLDVKESYIYDEYPDRVSLDRLAETILGLIQPEKNIPRETQRNIVKVLLYEEIVRRRK